jgi:hypothetical protein
MIAMLRFLLAIIFIASVPTISVAQMILLADTQGIESSSKVMQRIRQEALQAQKKKIPTAAQLSPEYADALELSLSDIRAAMPALIATLAKAQKADAVLEPAIAKQHGLSGKDVSLQISQQIDAQFAKSKFMPP